MFRTSAFSPNGSLPHSRFAQQPRSIFVPACLTASVTSSKRNPVIYVLLLWLISLSIMIPWFVHVIACVRIFFLMFHFMFIPHLFTLSPSESCGYYHHEDRCTNMSLRSCWNFGYIPKRFLCVFSLCEASLLLTTAVSSFYSLTSSAHEFWLLHIFPNACYFVFAYTSDHPDGYEILIDF